MNRPDETRVRNLYLRMDLCYSGKRKAQKPDPPTPTATIYLTTENDSEYLLHDDESRLTL